VGKAIETIRFNVAVANIYELANTVGKAISTLGDAANGEERQALSTAIRRLVMLAGPFVPHLAETCWRRLGEEALLADTKWPEVDDALLVEDTVTLPVQVNGKRRGEIAVARGAPQADIEAATLSLDTVQRMLEGRAPKKLIIVPDRIVNVVI
jgi:leucyl-tRNA synthetase